MGCSRDEGGVHSKVIYLLIYLIKTIIIEKVSLPLARLLEEDKKGGK